MKPTPESIEKLVHETLCSLPPRRAPGSLETRVLAALAARATLPWWRQAFARWPLAAQGAFVVVAAGLAKGVSLIVVGLLSGFDRSPLAAAFATRFGWIENLRSLAAGVGDFCAILLHGIPAPWLYGGLAGVTALYLILFGLGATAYRTLYAHR
jgi:hypothetical protein